MSVNNFILQLDDLLRFKPSEENDEYILEFMRNLINKYYHGSHPNKEQTKRDIIRIFKLLLEKGFDTRPFFDSDFMIYLTYYPPNSRKMKSGFFSNLTSEAKKSRIFYNKEFMPIFEDIQDTWIYKKQNIPIVEEEMKSTINYDPHILNIVKGYVGFARRSPRRGSRRRSRRGSRRRSRRRSPSIRKGSVGRSRKGSRRRSRKQKSR
jgi:hypothetical protein